MPTRSARQSQRVAHQRWIEGESGVKSPAGYVKPAPKRLNEEKGCKANQPARTPAQSPRSGRKGETDHHGKPDGGQGEPPQKRIVSPQHPPQKTKDHDPRENLRSPSKPIALRRFSDAHGLNPLLVPLFEDGTKTPNMLTNTPLSFDQFPGPASPWKCFALSAWHQRFQPYP